MFSQVLLWCLWEHSVDQILREQFSHLPGQLHRRELLLLLQPEDLATLRLTHLSVLPHLPTKRMMEVEESLQPEQYQFVLFLRMLLQLFPGVLQWS